MKVELKEWSLDYVDNIAKVANNQKIANNLRNAFPYPYTKEDAKWYINDCITKGENNQLTRAIVADGLAVGSIGVFVGNDVYCKSGELGYWLSEECWGKGIMTNAAKEICSLAFQKFDIVRIYAEPFSCNIGSRRILEKSGFELEGIMKNGVFKNNEVFDYCMYGLIK